jgi:hypothetical protein
MKHIDQVETMIKVYEGFEIDGVKLELCISSEEVNALLLAYDPDDFNSPDIVTCRAIARLVLDALKSVE